MSRLTLHRGALAIMFGLAPVAFGADDPATGKSAHGAAFDAGPRQAAVKLNGSGVVDFPVTTKSPEAQAFVTQGVGLLHGFWYYEAERSFRTAAMLDPDCPMAYWGMAFANLDNESRAKAFITEAMMREAKATPREKLYIDALDGFLNGRNRDNAARRRELCRKYEAIAHEFPTDLEAKAFLIWQIWDSQLHGMPIDSKMAVNALVGEVLAANPRHPAHHYRIHLTNGNDVNGGLPSAAACGPVAPAVPHMWHMPGHIYVDAKRYADAAWQMEAAMRLENAYMMRMHMTPDEVHLYVHNRGWLIDNLEYAGHVRDAIDLCKHIIELPRHPGYRQHVEAGRKLMEILARHERWDELHALENSDHLPPTDDRREQARRLVAFGRADLGRGEQSAAIGRLTKVNDLCDDARRGFAAAWAAAFGPNHFARVVAAAWGAGLGALTQPRSPGFAVDLLAVERLSRQPGAKGKPDGIRDKYDLLQALDRSAAELRGHIALANGGAKAARDWFAQAGDLGPEIPARSYAVGGNAAKADELSRDTGRRVYRLANRVDVLNQVGKAAEARAAFADLRMLAGAADLDDPPLARLAPLARSYGWPTDWRTPVAAGDVGYRPPLETLGPFRWQPWPAADWALADADGRVVHSSDHRGKPVVLIFYLGIGCVHCVEQLNAFLPKTREFAEAGIDVIAIGTDTPDTLKGADTDGKYPFTVLSDRGMTAFRAFGAFDEFERLPLHGTFLIDAAGRVRWQDIGSEPFKDADFLLTEAKRLLKRN